MIIVDIETTGTDPRKNAIISIGAVDFSNPENTFYEECCIWDQAEVDDKALEINGFTKEKLNDQTKKSEVVLLTEFLTWADKCKDKIISGNNSGFDWYFLNYAVQRYPYLEWIFSRRVIDLHSLCYAHHMKRKIQLPEKVITDTIFKYVGLPDEPKPHNALTGAKMEAEAFSRLLHGKNLIKEFEKYSIPAYLQ